MPHPIRTLSLAVLLVAGSARAAEPSAPRFSEQLVLDTGRSPFVPPQENMRAQVHGEYQLRYLRHSDLALIAPPGRPGADSLGQQTAVLHWLRITPRLYITRRISIIAQLDYPRGYMVGDDTQFVTAADFSMNKKAPFQADARWLYLDAATAFGHWRIGQQPWHWGMGLFANDGNHPSLFGDYRKGSIVERVMVAFNPAGARSPLSVGLAADLVYRDNFAKLGDRDFAGQGVLILVVGSDLNQLGVQGVVREQARGSSAQVPSQPYTDSLRMRALDVFGKFTARVPGSPGFVFGQAEGVLLTGTTRYAQNPGSGAPELAQSVRAWGAAFVLGAVHEATREQRRWGDAVLAMEWGYASGDGDPYDRKQTRFTFDPNHKVGLLLFDHAMHWMTARAAVNGDLALRGSHVPGLQLMPSNGGVPGAAYFYPTAIVRPRHWLDLKAAVLIAQATSDLVDPYASSLRGKRTNFQGGDPSRRDLGVELDLGVAARFPIGFGVTTQLGAEGGMLFPGHAFDDNTGNGLSTQFLVMGRAGLQY